MPTTSLLSDLIASETWPARASSFCTESRLNVAAPGEGAGAPPDSVYSLFAQPAAASAAAATAPTYTRRSFTVFLLVSEMRRP